jgi:transcriptional regulator with XRE-family HTH domain
VVAKTPSKIHEFIGEKLKKLRIDKGYTSYEQFAIAHDLHAAYYWNIEKGRNISIDYLQKLLNIHGLTFEEFFKDSGI